MASKADVANPDKLVKLAKFAKKKRLPFFPISAVTGEGVKDLTWAMAHEVRDLREGRTPEFQTKEIVLEADKPSPKPRTKKTTMAKKKSPTKKKVASRKAAKKTAAKKTAARKRTAKSK